MKFKIKQKEKKLYSGNFEIIQNEQVIGNVTFKGKLGSVHAHIHGNIFGKSFDMQIETNKTIQTPKELKKYMITENDINIGCIYQTERKTGIFTKYTYKTGIYKENEFNAYGISFGKEYSYNPIYMGDIQVAEIIKMNVVYNDLHEYEIYAKDEENAYLAVIVACYNYITTAYKPGVEVTESINKYYHKDINKELISKYNPNWIKNIES